MTYSPTDGLVSRARAFRISPAAAAKAAVILCILLAAAAAAAAAELRSGERGCKSLPPRWNRAGAERSRGEESDLGPDSICFSLLR